MIYRIARLLWNLVLFAFFRRITVEGLERIPATGPVLLVANHANGLIDGLLILTRLDRRVTLSAGSAFPEGLLGRALLRALGAIADPHASEHTAGIPRDPSYPAATAGAVRRRLRDGGAVCVFPEGASHSDPAVRPFGTDVSRIALESVTAGPGSSPAVLAIVPIGLHYERKDAFRSSVEMLVGEPVDAAAWHRAHPEGGEVGLTAEIERRVRDLTANFDARRDSFLFTHAAELLETADREPVPLGRARAEAAERVRRIRLLQEGARRLRAERPDQLAALESRVARYRRELSRKGISPAEVWLPIHTGRAAFFLLRELELGLIGLPLAAWGVLNHLLPYWAVRGIVRRRSVGRERFASTALCVGLPVFALGWVTQATLAALILPLPAAALYASSLPYTGAIALLYGDRVGSAWRRSRTFVTFLRHPEEHRRLKEEARGIALEIRGLSRTLEAGSGPSSPAAVPTKR